MENGNDPKEHVPVSQADDHHDHDHEAGGVCEHHQATFEVTLLVPKPNFLGASGATTASSTNEEDIDNYVTIYLPASGADCIRDLKQTVIESAEGFWIGSHSFRRVQLKEAEQQEENGKEQEQKEDVKPTFTGKPSDVLSENADLASVFAGEEYKSPEFRRVLKVVETPYSESDARNHLLRLRDTSLGYAVALQMKKLYQPPPYDPAAMAIDGGLSVFTAIRGPVNDENGLAEKPINGMGEANVNGQSDEDTSAVNGKKGKGKSKAKGPPPQAKKISSSTPASSSPKKTDYLSSSSWLTEEKGAFDVHLGRKELLKELPSPLTSIPFKNLQLSTWNPPPQHLRLRGHHLYLNITTLEGDNFHVTASAQGFYINRSDNHHFDPSPKQASTSGGTKAAQASGKIYHSLYSLLAAVSPQFSQKTKALLADSHASPTDIFASALISNCLPAAPWLTQPPEIIADSLRSQAAYLLSGSLGADSLPSARDWNEELTTMREMPKETQEERLIRERFASRLMADFQLAAARGASAIGRGDVACLSSLDSNEARTYLINNILFTLAEDSVDAFSHLGKDEAARVTSAKDLWAAKLLNDADIPHLHTIATAVVDYAGERWVAQAIPPGIFQRGLDEVQKEAAKQAEDTPQEKDGDSKSDKKPEVNGDNVEQDKKSQYKPVVTPGLRAVYGPANTDKPNEGYVASEAFEPLAKQIAQHFHLAQHAVKDTQGRETELWTPADMHGVVAADGRAYVIDLFRFFPVDVNFLEQNLDGKLFNEATSSSADIYPHRVTLLRPELIEIYHTTKAREWIEEQVKAKSGKKADGQKQESVPAIENGTPEEDGIKVEKVDAQADDAVKESTEAETQQGEAVQEKTTIDVGDFKLTFNPDAFVDRPDLKPHTASTSSPDSEDEATAAVRNASTFLRTEVIPALLREAINDEVIPLDSAQLSSILHKKGINIRYLGFIAEECKKVPQFMENQKLSKDTEEEVLTFLGKFRDTLLRDMVVRGAKHVLRRYIAGLRSVELTEAIAHFLNCLLGPSASSPKAINSTSSQAEWSNLSQSRVRDEITREIQQRFRFSIEPELLQQKLPKPQILREVCLATGIQLQLKAYDFEEHVQNPDSANVSQDEAASSSTAKKGKKTQSNGVGSTSQDPKTSFVPEDILNVYGVVKQAPFRSALAEDLFQRGQMYYLRGAIDHGEAFVNDGLNYYEQIFGSIHPELAEAYRTLANLYHRLAQPLLRRIQIYEASMTLPREEDRARARTETGFSDDEAVQQAKFHHEMFLQQAVKVTRQAVIISERTTGLDSYETHQCYSDLAIFEHAVGNVELAMKLLEHSVRLSETLYGDNHPEKAKAAFFAASMMKSMKQTQTLSGNSTLSPSNNQSSIIPYYQSASELATKAYGPNSIIAANSSYQLAQCYILDGNLADSIPHVAEAQRIFEKRLGKNSENEREASQLLAAVKLANEQRERGETEKVQKLAKRLGSDPARAKELLSRQASASSRGKANAAADANGSAEVASVDDKTGSRGHLDVDELVQFIQGGPATKKSAKTKGKKVLKK